MNIGIIAHDAHPIAEPYQGGLEMITHLLIKTLSSYGHKVTVLCLEGSDLDEECVFYPEKQKYSTDVEARFFDDITHTSSALNAFFSKDFDVIHNHSLHFLSILLGNQIHTPLITTFHTPIFEMLSVGVQSISSHINQTFTAVSASLSNTYKEILPEVMVVHNGIDLSLWDYDGKIELEYYSWSGRICKEKGLREIIALCEKNKLPLIFAGPISNRDYYDNEIAPLLKNSQYCHYIGHLDQKQLNNLIKNSVGFIFSSIWSEPYGLVIAEALASGVPVIANNVGAASEIIDESSGSLFSLHDEESFIHSTHVIRNLHRIDCRRRAEFFCSHHEMVDAYLKIYEFIITKHYVL